MKRIAFDILKNWKQSKFRKPLIINGARQVGKTWLMKEFGHLEYKKTAYINMENNENMRLLFSIDFNIQRILEGLKIESGVDITPQDTLIIFDEIQENIHALNALKYFYENNPRYHIISAGSLLGVSLNHKGMSFPVGKVEFMTLYPMSFCEFLDAIGQESLCEKINQRDFSLISAFKQKYSDLLKTYFFVGGMPEAVSMYVQTKDFQAVRAVQNNLLDAYTRDFSKHINPVNIPKLNMIWKSIPAQLSKENQKFIYGMLKEGGRAKEFEDALNWLVQSGLVYQIHKIKKPDIPLSGYEDNGSFKIFLLDTGLLCAMTMLDAKTLLEGNKIFEEFKGSLTEQFVLQELKTLQNIHISYWSNRNTEVDFVVQIDDKVIPLEVKATTNLRAKSLKSYIEKERPEIAVRSSLADFKKTDMLLDIPLFAIEQIKAIVKENF